MPVFTDDLPAAHLDADADVDTETEAGAAPILYRARKGRLLFGVCAGTAAYVGWDVWLIRGLFVALTCIGGLGVLVYLGGALLVPLAPTTVA